jgi:hypothetical protein
VLFDVGTVHYVFMQKVCKNIALLQCTPHSKSHSHRATVDSYRSFGVSTTLQRMNIFSRFFHLYHSFIVLYTSVPTSSGIAIYIKS